MTRAGAQQPILLVEDHTLLAESLRIALASEGIPADHVVPDDLDAVRSRCLRAAPATVLLDLDLGLRPGDGPSLVRPLTDGGCRVLVVTGSADLARWGRCLEDGAIGVVSKSLPFDGLLDAARQASAGGRVMDEAQRLRAATALRDRRTADRTRLAPFERLTPREQEVLEALMNGKPAAVIAGDSVVSEATIRSQIRAVLGKLGVTSQLAAVSVARQARWRPRRT